VLVLAALGLAAVVVARLRAGERPSGEPVAELRAGERASPSGAAARSGLQAAVSTGAPRAPSGSSADHAISPRAAGETSAPPAPTTGSPPQFVLYGRVRDAEDGSPRIWKPTSC
jgi:hypothetical protein